MSPRFHYQAKEGPEKIVEGVIDAQDYNAAIDVIMANGLTPLEVKEKALTSVQQRPARKASLLSWNKKITRNDLVIFTRQMSDLLGSAVLLFKALQIIANQTKHQELRRVVNELAQSVQDGAAFSEALYQHELFPMYYVNMVRAGEVGGHLEVILDRLAGYLEKEQEMSGKIKASLAYPLFVLAIGLVTVFVLLSFVIPRLTVMFEDFDQSLPTLTMILVNVSTVFAKSWWIFILAGALSVEYLRQWTATEAGRKWIDTHVLRLWILGSFIQTVEVGRFARILGTLIESGVTVVTALETVTNIVENSVLKEELKKVSFQVEQGASLGNALREGNFFPEMAVNMISTGEEAGRFEKGLYKIADIYERESERMMQTTVALLGPAVLTIVIVIIGFIVIAMLLPILQMNQLIR